MKGITPGDWEYRPSNSRQVVSETGETICKVHRGKKAQFNGPLLAASPRLLEALIWCVDDMLDCESKSFAEEVIREAKGEQ